MRRILVPLALVALVAAVFVVNGLREGNTDESLLHVATPDALPVLVTQPQREPIVRTVQAPGDVEAVLEVEISSEVPAKIEEMPVEEGDTVKSGQLLCRLNDVEYRALVDSGEAGVEALRAGIRQADADLEKCQRDLTRQERLAERNATSALELADHRTTLVKAQAAVDLGTHQLAEAQAMLRRARENLEKTIIVSPIDGIVSKVQAEQGEVVVTGTMNNPGTVIMTITDLAQMQVRARVDETDVPLVKPGQSTDIFLPSDPQRPILGRVLRVATSGSKAAGRDVVTFETLVLIETDDPRVKPGMTANVEIEVARKDDVLTVPVQAVVHRKRKDLPEEIVEQFDRRQAELGITERKSKAQYLAVVFSLDEGEATPHCVRTGIADEARVELIEGLAVDDQIITGPYRSLDQLKQGSKVKLDEPEDSEKTTDGAEEDTALADADDEEAAPDVDTPDDNPDATEVAKAE
ncbi:MAG: efflux RND transporter periplasmic adaptor subunit [bacterium]|nr:efflux RND transporter periplasmic adaptor subunit [bacterium]